MTQRKRIAKKIEMRDYRNRKRLAEFKIFFFLLKDKIDRGEVKLTDDLAGEMTHMIKVASQI